MRERERERERETQREKESREKKQMAVKNVGTKVGGGILLICVLFWVGIFFGGGHFSFDFPPRFFLYFSQCHKKNLWIWGASVVVGSRESRSI